MLLMRMCRYAFYTAMNKMYGIKEYFSALPPMPADGGTWSVMHSWVLPTRSFLEFIMFSRMLVAELDAQFYHEHRQSGFCYLSVTKDKHCYSRMLELVINVWAYQWKKNSVCRARENINGRTAQIGKEAERENVGEMVPIHHSKRNGSRHGRGSRHRSSV